MDEGDDPNHADRRIGADGGLVGLFGQLAADAQDVAQAELALAKARANDVIARYKLAAILFAVAGTLGLAALIALLVGLIETLAPHVGPGFATTIVVGTVSLIAGVMAMIGKSRLSAKPRVR